MNVSERASQDNCPQTGSFSGWFVRDQNYEVTVEINPNRSIGESNYEDNSFSFTVSPVAPSNIIPLSFPVAAVPHQEVTLGGYIDLDNGPGVQDFRGGKLTYNGHEGIDINPRSIEQIDAGLPILAPADGVVIRVFDGYSDFGGDGGSNGLEIDHGGGLTTAYGHLRRDSIRVSVGQFVARGDAVAYMGGSKDGIPHLHFEVKYEGREIEPNLLPESFWEDGISYPLDVKSVLEVKSTNYDWSGHQQEGSLNFSPVNTFVRGLPNSPRFVARTNGMVPGDVLYWRLYRPNGSLYASWTTGRNNEPEVTPHTWMAFNPIMPAHPELGIWRLAIEINGVELAEHQIEYVDDVFPVIRVETYESLYLHPNRYRPLVIDDSGETFSVINHGTAPWSPHDLSVPHGFRLIEGLPEVIAPGESATFVVGTDASWSGHAVGQIEIADDYQWDDGRTYRFAIEKRFRMA